MSETPLLAAALRLRRGALTLDVHLSLRSGWTVLFGRSGAGKTTLLRILSGLIHPDRGRIELAGRILTDTAQAIALAPARRGIGFVLQQASLFPHLSARDNIAFGLHRWRRVEREARTEELLAAFGAEAFAERKPRELSGGERQRIALAQALAPRPKLLLLDEPFNAIDAGSRRGVVESLRATAVPVLYVSHDLTDVWQSNADAVVLDRGRIVACGATREVLSEERNLILAELGSAESAEKQNVVR